MSATIYDGESDYDFVKRVSDKRIRQFMRENDLDKAQITNKDLNFSIKEKEIGTEREIQINQEILDGSEQSV